MHTPDLSPLKDRMPSRMPTLCTVDHRKESHMKKLYLLAGLAVGYVLGTKAGRSRYEEMSARFHDFKEHPKVQEAASKAAEASATAAAAAKDKAADAAATVADKVKKDEDPKAVKSDAATEDEVDPLAGPKGPLP